MIKHCIIISTLAVSIISCRKCEECKVTLYEQTNGKKKVYQETTQTYCDQDLTNIKSLNGQGAKVTNQYATVKTWYEVTCH